MNLTSPVLFLMKLFSWFDLLNISRQPVELWLAIIPQVSKIKDLIPVDRFHFFYLMGKIAVPSL